MKDVTKIQRGKSSMHLVRGVALGAQLGQQAVVIEVAKDSTQPDDDADVNIGREALELSRSDVRRRGEAVSGDEEEHVSCGEIQRRNGGAAQKISVA